MSFCGWNSGEVYKDHFENGKYYRPVSFGCNYSNVVMIFMPGLFFFSPLTLQVSMYAPSVAMTSSTVPPSSSTLLRGLHSQRQ